MRERRVPVRVLRLARFRNYDAMEVQLHPRLNLFLGENAQGKTNILEALHCLSTTRSFRSASDDEMIAFGRDEAAVEAEADQELGRESLRLEFRRRRGKSLFIDSKKRPKLSELLGRLPSVVFSPDDLFLVKGASLLRRRLLDVTLLQMDPVYLAHLQQYERGLHQRNALLRSRAPGIEPQLPVWDEALAVHGAALMVRRRVLVERFAAKAGAALAALTGGAETFEVAYAPDVTWEGEESVCAEVLRAELQRARRDDLLRGTSTTGPHRDDVKLRVNGRSLRDYGSQGQMRSGVLALKLAQWETLAEGGGRRPLVLFDDVMAELDAGRQAFFLEKLKSGGQVLLTGTAAADFAAARGEARVFRVSDGMITQESQGPVE
jgi:DNA replication and repair protein RecF